MTATATWITLTAGRIPQLEEVIACFLAQKCDGRLEMIIVNTWPAQTLVFEHERVKVFNLPHRPDTMGEARNIAVARASGGLMIVADDDDAYLPQHTANFMRSLSPGIGWIQQTREFYAEKYQVKSIVPGSCNVVAFTKEAFRTVGCYRRLNSGEDRDFIGRLTSQCHGVKVELADDEVSYIRSWDNGLWHISGNGEDRPGQATGMQRTTGWLEAETAAGHIPTGRIVLQPKMTHDWQMQAERFTQAKRKLRKERVGKVGITMLGRYGDIINVLPIAKAVADRWGKPYFFVAKEFSDVLDGVSYVKPMPLDLPYDAINEAVALAKTKCEYVLNAQVYGHKFSVPRNAGSFNFSSWAACGFAQHFYDFEGFPLVFDRRNKPREEALIREFALATREPTMLLSVNCGRSSPFKDSEAFQKYIIDRWGKRFNVIDLCKFKAERLFDLLGLMDVAALLITSDTAPLHLAAASKVPVVALVNDNKQDGGSEWLASIPRSNCVLRLRYSEVMESIAQVDKVIGGLQCG